MTSYRELSVRRKEIEEMPLSEKRVAFLRRLVADVESMILEITLGTGDYSYRLKILTEFKRDLIFLLGMRCWALNKMFHGHCTDDEINQFIKINEHLYAATQHMYERAKMAQDLMLTMPIHAKDDDIWVESKLRFWDDDPVSTLDDDSYYGSDFSHIIPLIATMDSELLKRDDIEYICNPTEIIEGKVTSKYEIVNNMDDGVSWAEGNLKHSKLSNVIICHAVHEICVHKNYSIPDLLRMNSYEVLVELKIQSFHDLHVNGSSSN